MSARCGRPGDHRRPVRFGMQTGLVGDVLDVMRQLASEGMTMLVVTHEMGFARKAGDRVLFMADGEIVEDAPPEQFFTNPTSNRAKDFLSKILTH